MDPQVIKQNSIEYFDSIAKRNKTIPEPVRCYEAVLEELASHDFTVLADIGCGTGEMLKRIREQYGEGKLLLGVDISPKSIEVAETALRDKAKLVVGDVDDLPLEDRSVDVALNMHSFHHYPHPARSLKEMRRVLKYGGYLLMVENDYPLFKRLKGNIRHIVTMHIQGDVKMYSVKELVRMIQKAGLRVEASKPIAKHSRLYICRK